MPVAPCTKDGSKLPRTEFPSFGTTGRLAGAHRLTCNQECPKGWVVLGFRNSEKGGAEGVAPPTKPRRNRPSFDHGDKGRVAYAFDLVRMTNTEGCPRALRRAGIRNDLRCSTSPGCRRSESAVTHLPLALHNPSHRVVLLTRAV